jgi:hypothetical protein
MLGLAMYFKTSLACEHQYGDFVPCPDHNVPIEGDKDAMGAHAFGLDSVRFSTLTSSSRRNNLDVIVEPLSFGCMIDERGTQRSVAFLTNSVNGQDIMEGLASNFLLIMGGLGLIILDPSMQQIFQKLSGFLHWICVCPIEFFPS